MTQIKKEFQRS